MDVNYAYVWGSAPFWSTDGFCSYVLFIDHFSKYVWLYPLKQNSDVPVIFPQFKSLVENQFNSKIKTLFTDNRGEFVKLRPFLSINGISHITTPPYTPKQNGLAKRKHRHLVETARCLLNHTNIPLRFWSFAIQTEAYVINCPPTPTLQHQTPYSVLFKQPPTISNFVFLDVFAFPG